jgi:hypothetical protein
LRKVSSTNEKLFFKEAPEKYGYSMDLMDDPYLNLMEEKIIFHISKTM